MDIEPRVAKLEDAMSDIRVQLAGIAEKLAVLPRLEAKLDIASIIQLADVRVSGAEQLEGCGPTSTTCAARWRGCPQRGRC
jgi:hypothetical protein